MREKRYCENLAPQLIQDAGQFGPVLGAEPAKVLVGLIAPFNANAVVQLNSGIGGHNQGGPPVGGIRVATEKTLGLQLVDNLGG